VVRVKSRAILQKMWMERNRHNITKREYELCSTWDIKSTNILPVTHQTPGIWVSQWKRTIHWWLSSKTNMEYMVRIESLPLAYDLILCVGFWSDWLLKWTWIDTHLQQMNKADLKGNLPQKAHDTRTGTLVKPRHQTWNERNTRYQMPEQLTK